ncbi:kinesin-like protein KIN-7J [Chenopodium quinoa]|uniref:kinesin-like protein KIN-7J n=1 Tax=Chenopodium quinoa TaxID=63459 RepID=UPI000B77C80D|nr:kinesin-like protein KIN-7J [Chenopodium quinoa]
MVAGGDHDLQQWNAQGSDARHEKIFVSVRLRPLNEKEIQSNDFADWESINSTTILFKNGLGERSTNPNAYNFDRVFGHNDSTRKVYEEAAKEIALSVLNGINSSVFAYGQTSSGKTFTMNGITHYAVADIYDYIEQQKEREFVLKFSAIEIYNELVRDLLSTDTNPLRLLDDPERGTVVEKLTEETLQDKSHLLELIAVCEAQRQTGETSLNEASSRSHQILRLTIESSARRFGGGNSSILAANVNFVDLAGSERTSQTLATGARLKEGSHINRSLLTLGKVIRTLSKGKNGHIPYRDSKLTRILQNSLGGNARTAIICTMSPAHSHLEQSRNTLLFASCAKEVSTNAQVNVVMSDKALVKQLRKELAKLESDLKNMPMVSSKGDVAAALREKEIQIEKMDKEIKELSRQRDLAQTKVEELLQSSKKEVSKPQDDEYDHHRIDSRDKLSWFDDTSEISDGSDYRRLDADLATSESFQYLDQQDNFDLSTQRSDLLENIYLLPNESSLQPLDDTTLDFTPVDLSLSWGEMGSTGNIRRRIDEDDEDNCKEVRCIEVEERSISKNSESSVPVMISPREKEIQEEGIVKDVHEREHTISDDEIESEEEKENENEKERFNVKEKKYAISAGKNEDNETPHSAAEYDAPVTEKNEEKESHHCDSEHDQLVKRIKELQRTIDMLVNHNPLGNFSPCSIDSERLSNKGSSFSRSRSCKAILTSNPASSIIFDKVVLHSRDLSFAGFGEEISSERPKGLPRGSDHIPTGNGKPSRFGLPIPSIRNAIMNEMERDAKNSDVSDASSFYSSAVETNGNAEHESGKQMGYEMDGNKVEEENEPKDSESSESARDVSSYVMRVRDSMSEGAMSTAQSPANWFEEFESLRFKIIELWHACHIPLVHRTYFYLLFKGDTSDKIYLEVELRRLSFIKNRFDQGQKIVVDGEVSTPSSSMRALNQEREMLMRQMYKKIPVQERESIFEQWGITMNSKQRRLQLARRLWTDTKDMQHIRESATLVAKLVGFVDEGQVPKEMFVGPSITTKSINRRSYSWKSSMSRVS